MDMEIQPGEQVLDKILDLPKIRLDESDSSVIKALASSLPPEFLEDYRLTENQISKLERQLKREKTRGLQTVGSMICTGVECAMSDTCALFRSKVTPLGLHCPVESMFMEQLREQFMYELNIKSEDLIEIVRLNDLIQSMVIERRAAAQLSQETITENEAALVTNDGDVITKRKSNVLIDIMDKCRKQKEIILKEFLATREARLKYGTQTRDDKSMHESKLAEIIQQVEADIVK